MYEKKKLDRKDHVKFDMAAKIVRILLTPIFIWYRLYLWVWDGSMFDHK